MQSKLLVAFLVALSLAVVVVVIKNWRGPAAPTNHSVGVNSESNSAKSSSMHDVGRGPLLEKEKNDQSLQQEKGEASSPSSASDSNKEETQKDGAKKDAKDDRPQLPAPLDYGRIKPVPGDANQFVAQAIEAMKTGQQPHRLSPLIAPPKFDPAKLDEYLNTIAPGRCYQVADPGPQVPQLRHEGPHAMRARQDETVVLRARAIPNAPVTFTSLHAGFFEKSLLPTITVAADKKGVAEAKYKPGSGVTDDVRIVAGCPLCSGTIRFLVIVEPVQVIAAPSKSAPENETTR